MGTFINLGNYPVRVAQYSGELLLVGISYDRQSKQHTCQIEHINVKSE